MSELDPDLAALLAHQQWIRELARSLVRDPQEFEDTLSEFWVRVFQRPPIGIRNVLAWANPVLRNIAAQRRSSELARRRREQSCARNEAHGAEIPYEESARLHRRVVSQVLELDEPYRTVVLMRYFGELPPTEIAARLGIPLATVSTRLARAHERLRERLRRELGDELDLRSGLAPLLLGRRVARWPRVVASRVAFHVACAAAVVVLVGWYWWSRPRGVDANSAAQALTPSHDGTSSTSSASERSFFRTEVPAEQLAASSVVPGASLTRHARVIWQSSRVEASSMGPRGLAVAPTGELFAIDYDSRTILKFEDGARFVGQSDLLDRFSGAAFSSGRLVVSAPGGSLVALDASTLTKVGQIHVDDPQSQWLVGGVTCDRFGNLQVLSSGARRVFCVDGNLQSRYDWPVSPSAVALSAASNGLAAVITHEGDASALEFYRVEACDRAPLPGRGRAECKRCVWDIALSASSLFVATESNGVFVYAYELDERGAVRDLQLRAFAPHGAGIPATERSSLAHIAVDESRHRVFVSYAFPAAAIVALSLEHDFLSGDDLDAVEDPLSLR